VTTSVFEGKHAAPSGQARRRGADPGRHSAGRAARWEKVLFRGGKYRQLAEIIESHPDRASDVGTGAESVAGHSGREGQKDLGGCGSNSWKRSRGHPAREDAPPRELAIRQAQQQQSPSIAQVQSSRRGRAPCPRSGTPSTRAVNPARLAIEQRQTAPRMPHRALRAAEMLASASEAYEAGAPRNRRPRGRRRGGAQRGVFSPQFGPRPSGMRLEHASAARDKVAEHSPSLTSKPMTSGSNPLVSMPTARPRSKDWAGRTARSRPPALPGLRGVGAGECADRARMARPLGALPRARSGRSRSASEITGALEAARAGYGDAPRAVLAQANARSTSRARLPTISKWSRGTSEPSKPASAICCSTSWSTLPSMPRRDFRWCATRRRAAADS